MIKTRDYWTYDKCKKESLKYKTKKEFREKNSSVYTKINKKRWYDLFNHMKKSENNSKRCIYSYEFFNQYVYIGLTNNLKRRNKDHLKNGIISKYIKQYNITPKLIQLTNYIDVNEAKKKEQYYIDKYKKENWFVLNKIKGGSIGSPIIKWSKEKIQKKALEFEFRSDFQKEYPGAYQRALKNNILNEVCQHMRKKKKKKYIKWTYEKCKNEASKYNTKTEFKHKSNYAYKISLKNNFLNEICLHMNKRNKWNFDNVIKEAKKYNTKTDFSKQSRGAYNFAYRNNILDQVCSHMIKEKF